MASLELNLLANTREFQKGTKDAADSLDKVADTLDDVARDGEKSGERLERSFREIADAAKRESKKVGDSFEANSKRGFGRASQAARSFKDEARQNFAEVASSFDGTAQGIADGIQGTLGGAAVAVGGAAGLAIGTLGIIGGTILQRVTEDAEKAEQRIQTMYDAFTESGLNYLTEEQLLAQVKELGDDATKFAELQRQAKDTGLQIGVILAAQVGDAEARNTVQARLNELIAEGTQKLEDGSITLADNLPTLEAYRDQYVKLNAEQAESVQRVEGFREAVEQITGQQKLTNEEIQIQNRLLAETPKTLPVVVDLDQTAIDKALQKRTLRIDIEGYTRTGARVV